MNSEKSKPKTVFENMVVGFVILCSTIGVLLLIYFCLLFILNLTSDNSQKKPNSQNEELCDTDSYGRGVDVEVCQPLPDYDYQ